MTFIAGPYTATYDGNTLGTVESGFDIEQTILGEIIVGDNLGGSTQDGVYQGANFNVEMILQDWDLTAVQALMWPFDANFGESGQVGRLWSNLAKQLILTPVAGTTAAAATTPIYTASLSLLEPNFPLKHLLKTGLRNLPVRLMLLPTISGADTTWFTRS